MELNEFLGGGTGAIIGTLGFINAGGVKKHTDETGGVWLRAGVIETDTSLYPKSVPVPAFTGLTHSIASHSGTAQDVTWDGTHFWLLDSGTNRVSKWNADWSYAGFDFSVVTQEKNAAGLVFADGHLWVSGGYTDKAYKYTLAGAYTGVSINMSHSANPRGLAFDGSYLYMCDSTSKAIHKYTLAGAYQGVAFTCEELGASPSGLVWTGDCFYLADLGKNIYQYDAGGSYTGVNFPTPEQPFGMTFAANKLYYAQQKNDVVVECPFVVGLARRIMDPDSKQLVYKKVA